MKTEAEFINIHKLEVEVKITMSISDWIQFQEQITTKESDCYPTYQVLQQIKDVIQKLKTVAYKYD